MTSRTSMDANAPREVAYAAAASRVSGHDVSALVLTPPPPPRLSSSSSLKIRKPGDRHPQEVTA